MLFVLVSHYRVKSQVLYRELYYLLGKDTFTIRKMFESSVFIYFKKCTEYWTGLYETR